VLLVAGGAGDVDDDAVGCDSVTSSAGDRAARVPTAVVSRPTDAGSAGTSSRTVIEYDALGMAMPASCRFAPPDLRRGSAERVGGAAGRSCYAVVLKPAAVTAAVQAASSWSPVPPLPPRAAQQDAVAVDRHRAGLRGEAAAGHRRDRRREVRHRRHLLLLRSARDAVRRGRPRLALRDVGGDPGSAVHAAERDEVAAGVHDGERHRHAGLGGGGAGGVEQAEGVVEGQHPLIRPRSADGAATTGLPSLLNNLWRGSGVDPVTSGDTVSHRPLHRPPRRPP
jgi:hypothetical protein